MPNQTQINAAIIALAVKRGERSSQNLSTLQQQLFEQLSEFELRTIARGKHKGVLKLKPLSKKTIIAIPKVDNDLPKVTAQEVTFVTDNTKITTTKKVYKKKKDKDAK